MINKVDRDFAIVYWTSAQAPRQEVQDAFDAEGYGNYVPKPDIQDACYRAAQRLAADYKISGPLKYFPLAANGGDCYGYEVRKFHKGVDKNEMPFCFSVGVYESPNGDYCAIRAVDTGEAPQLEGEDKPGSTANTIADNVYSGQLDNVTARDLTIAITKVLQDNAGFMSRKGGVVWTIPKRNLSSYVNIGRKLEKHGPILTGGVFPTDYENNADMVNQTARQVKDYLNDLYGGLIADAKEREHSGVKTRSNGEASRLEKLQQADALLSEWLPVLGELGEELEKASTAAKEMLGIAAIEAFA